MAVPENQINIFMSYAHEDAEHAQMLLNILDTFRDFVFRLHIWFDNRELIAGYNFNQRLSNGLQTSRVALCLYSKAYLRSDYCMSETRLAIDQNKPRIVLIIEDLGNDAKKARDLTEGLQTINAYDNQTGSNKLRTNDVIERIKDGIQAALNEYNLVDI